jgi:hypothetical protein
MSSTKQQEPSLRAVKMNLFPTMDTLDSVLNMATAKLPITCPNELRTLLFTYHNTLLKEIDSQQTVV